MVLVEAVASSGGRGLGYTYQLRFVREPVPMQVAAGEYGFDPWYFRGMLQAEALDVLQADATRCLGGTGFLEASEIALVSPFK